MGCGRAGGGSGAHRPGAQGRLTLTEGQNLELNAHVDGADLDSRGYGKESGGKTENEADPRRNEPITDRLGGCIRCGNDTDPRISRSARGRTVMSASPHATVRPMTSGSTSTSPTMRKPPPAKPR